MGLLGFSEDPVTDEVDKATDENNTEEDWGEIMNICDKAGKSSDDAKKYLRAITKRLYHSDPHVGVQAVVLLDACVKNSGKKFHLEVASREFENDFTRLLTKAHSSVATKLKECLKKWSENEFKTDTSLNLIPSLFAKLKTSGTDFNFSTDTAPKKTASVNKNPDAVDSNEEAEQIMKAIELSLKETTGSPKSTPLYPSTNVSTVQPTISAAAPSKDPVKVQALYDFEAAEDNELTFSAGDIIYVIDDSDANWWKGSNQKGAEGLFPSSFVTADLSVEPEKILYEKAKNIMQTKGVVDVKAVTEEINEEKIERLLHLMHEADPTNPDKDTEEMLTLECEVNAMGPQIDSQLEKVDKKYAQLTQLSADLVEALSLYHTLMREPTMAAMPKLPYEYPPQSIGYNGPQSLPVMGQQMMERPQFIDRIHYGPNVIPNNMQQMPPGPMLQQTNEDRKSMTQYGPAVQNFPGTSLRTYQMGSQANIQTATPNGTTPQLPGTPQFNSNTSSRMM